jgi:hypothetical protein
MGYQPRSKLVRDENNDALVDSHSILNRWKNHFCWLLNVHGDHDVGQIEIHITEPLVCEPSSFEDDIASKQLKGMNSQVLIKFQHK